MLALTLVARGEHVPRFCNHVRSIDLDGAVFGMLTASQTLLYDNPDLLKLWTFYIASHLLNLLSFANESHLQVFP
jgi:hypothetical protein